QIGLQLRNLFRLTGLEARNTGRRAFLNFGDTLAGSGLDAGDLLAGLLLEIRERRAIVSGGDRFVFRTPLSDLRDALLAVEAAADVGLIAVEGGLIFLGCGLAGVVVQRFQCRSGKSRASGSRSRRDRFRPLCQTPLQTR